jgi:hypothetical protein
MFEHIAPHHPAAIMTFMQRLAESAGGLDAALLTEREKQAFACGFAKGCTQTVDLIEDAEAVAAGEDSAAQIAEVARLREQAKAEGWSLGDRVFVPSDDAKRTLRALVVDADAAGKRFAEQLKG